MLLTGTQIQRIHKALLDGYTPESLRQMVRIALDERMEVIAGGANLSDQVMNLIEWSAAHDRTPELIAAAHTHNPRNAALAELDRDAQAWFVAPAPVALAAQQPVATVQPPAAPPRSRETRTMTRNRTVPITLAVISATLTLLLGLLVNLASTYIAEALRPYAPWVFVLLGVVFVASVAVLIWQMRAEPASSSVDAAGARIEQSATDGSAIVRSPNRIAGADNAAISQSAANKSRIEDSGNSIE